MSSGLSLSSPPRKDDIMRIASTLADVLKLPKAELEGLDAAGVCAWLRKNMPNDSGDRGITTNQKHQRDLCQKLSIIMGDSSQQREACGELASTWCAIACDVKKLFDAEIAELDSMIASCDDAKCQSQLKECKSRMDSVRSVCNSQSEEINSFARSAAGKQSVSSKEWADKMATALSAVPTVADMLLLVCDSCSEIKDVCAKCTHKATSGGGGTTGCGCDEPVNLFTGGWIHGGSSSVSGGLTIDSRVRHQTAERKRIMKEFRTKAEGLFNQLLGAVHSLGQRMGKGGVVINDDLLRFVESFSQLENVYTPGIEFALTGYYVHPSAAEQRERFLGKLQAVISTLGPLGAGSSGDVFREIRGPLEELQRHCDKASDTFRAGSSSLVQSRYGNPSIAGGDFKSFSDGLKQTTMDARKALHDAPGTITGVAKDVAETKQALIGAAATVGRGDENDQWYDDDVTAGGEMTKVGLTLKNVVKSLRHFYAVAKMRENLKKVSSESKSYSANYAEVLGKPFGALIDKERKAFDKFKEELAGPVSQSYIYGGAKIPIAAAYGTIKKAVEFGKINEGDNIPMEWNKEVITTMQLNSCNARIELYNVVQAIDLALMNFTDAITANPDEIKEISRMLDSTEIVAEWFNEASGDHVAGLFEYMPWRIHASLDGSTLESELSRLGKNVSGKEQLAIIDDKGSRLKKFAGGHYLTEVKRAEDAKDGKSHPGNPFLMISPARAEYAREFAKKTVDRMMAMKNIVSAFAYMGGRGRSGAAGGSESWEASRIYASLCKYLYTSAFAMGWDGYDSNVAGDDKKFQQFAKVYDSYPGHVNGEAPGSSIRDGKVLIGVLPFDNSDPWSELILKTSSSSLAREKFDIYEQRKGNKQAERERILREYVAGLSNNFDIALAKLGTAAQARNMERAEELHKMKTGIKLNKNEIEKLKRTRRLTTTLWEEFAKKQISDAAARPPVDYSGDLVPLMVTLKQTDAQLGIENENVRQISVVAAAAKDPTAQQTAQADLARATAIATGVKQQRDAAVRACIDKINEKSTETIQAMITLLTATGVDPVPFGVTDFKSEFDGVLNRLRSHIRDKKPVDAGTVMSDLIVPVHNTVMSRLKELASKAIDQRISTAFAIEDALLDRISKEIDNADPAVDFKTTEDFKKLEGISAAMAGIVSPELAKLVFNGLPAGKTWSDIEAGAEAAGSMDVLLYAGSMGNVEGVLGPKMKEFMDSLARGDLTGAKSMVPAEYEEDYKNIVDARARVAALGKATIAGGALPGLKSRNWLDFANAIEQTGGTRGWIIAYNPGDNAKDMTIVPPFARCAFGCAMNSIKLPEPVSGPFKTVGGWSGQFRDTDELFMRAIKAMVAKVMTVSGLYNMLNYASPDDHTMSATRFIVGGSSGGVDSPASTLGPSMVPQIHDDAVELYIRLPLLVEFYRDIYSLTGKRLGDEKKDSLIVALVPEIDQTWSSLMRLSFDNIGSGSVVSKNYASQMINEINVIYDRYKSRGSGNLVSTVVNDFIADVNSRFGIMTRLESAKYKEMMQANRRAFAGMRDDDILMDFDTLGDRDFSERKAAALPSDKFVKSTSGSPLEDTNEFNMGFIKALSDFRNIIDSKIRKVTFGSENPEMFATANRVESDFHEQARIAKNDLKLLTTPEQRFNAVYALMSGIDNVQKIDDNSYVMFHEVIMAPLAVLEGVSVAVVNFISKVKNDIWERVSSGVNDEAKINEVFVDVTKLIMSHVSSLSGMVDLSVVGTKVVVDHSKLQQFCEGLLAFVNRNIQKFRGTINSKRIEECEGRIRDLQTNLMESKFHDDGLEDAGLESASRSITRLFGIFAKGEDVYAEGKRVTVDLPKDGSGKDRMFSFCSAMRKLAYYDPYEIKANFSDVKSVLTRDSRLEKLFMKKIDGKDLYMYEDLMFASRWEVYENKNEFSDVSSQKTNSMGLMMRFNELLARYLEQFWDESNRKIYTPLISGIAANSDAAVHKAAGWPDLSLPKGNSSLPAGLNVSGPNWASTVARNFGASIGGDGLFKMEAPTWGVTFNVTQLDYGTHMETAYKEFIADLDNSSSAMAPTQLVNLLKHAFDRAASGMQKGNNQLAELETYRNNIVTAIGENWTKYGPIAAIAAAVFSLRGENDITPNERNSLAALLGRTKYEAPPIVPVPLSEFSQPAEGSLNIMGNPDEIMFASLGKVLRTMLTTQDKGVPLYVLPTLADSSATTPRMKENIRANLPIFTKMFGMLAEDCKILGNILSTGINVDDMNSMNAAEGYVTPQHGVHGVVFQAGFVNNERGFGGDAAKNYLGRLLGKIATSSNVMVTTGAEVMKEILDNPLFMETSENSIAAYRNITNVTPFMPLSSMVAGLQERKREGESNVLLPVHSPGARKFEFNYGTRFILGQPKVGALMDHAPGMREIVENYNKMVPNDKHITLENVSRALSEYVQLTRWLTDLNVYVPRICSYAQWSDLKDNTMYQLRAGASLDSAMNLTTNTDKPRMVAELARWVSSLGGSSGRDILDRERIQVMNILDLNVNPVNINALRREVPAINLLNYSLTFDSFAKDLMGVSEVPIGPLDHRGMFLALMLNPYMQKTAAEWDLIFSCYDDRSAGFGFGGHDRFAQDQIFRKALLYSGHNVRTRGRTATKPSAKEYAYPGKDKPGHNRDHLTPVNLDDQREYLDVLGRMRHDTTFIRNFLFISTAHRMMRVRVSEEMTKIVFPVVSGPPAASMHITDENVWETYDDLRRAYE
jgi:hypothetical protein